jgi:hypothetical protein
MAADPRPSAASVGPSAPKLALKDVRDQFWADAYGKEVQTAATYSYTWLADQFGHLAIGMVAQFAATATAGRIIVIGEHLATGWPFNSFAAVVVAGLLVALVGLLGKLPFGWAFALFGFFAPLGIGWVIAGMSGADTSEIWSAGLTAPNTNLVAMLAGLLITVAFVGSWELSAYRSSVKKATGAFPLDTTLLRKNALIATIYMVIGALMSFAFHLRGLPAWPRALDWIPVAPWLASWLLIGVMVAAAIRLAVPWLRQKITWQKAALPYLCRLADAAPTITDEDAKALQKIIDEGAPPNVAPCAILIGGPIGSGRTAMAAAIGTEFAFKNCKVRYLSLDALLEFAATAAAPPPFPDDHGPPALDYWAWSDAQVLIIDDVGPLIAAQRAQLDANIQKFRELLKTDLKSVAEVLGRCHTVWVVGDLRPDVQLARFGPRLSGFAESIKAFSSCGNVLMVELGEATAGPGRVVPREVRWLYPDTKGGKRAS